MSNDELAESGLDAKSGLQAALYALKLSWRSGRTDTIGLIAVPLIQSLVPAALTLSVRGLVNATVFEIDTGVSADPGFAFYVAVSFGLSALLACCNAALIYFTQRNLEALDHHLAIRMLEHAETLDFGYFENPEFHDTLQRARQVPGLHVHQTLTRSVRTISALVTLASLLAVLVRIEPWLIAYLLPLALPFLYHRWRLARTRFDTNVRQTRSRRWIRYFSGQLMDEESLAEARLLGLGPLFIDRATSQLGQIRAENRSIYSRQLGSAALFNVLAVIVVHIALFQAAVRTIDGELSVGDIAVFAGAAAAARAAIDVLITNVGQLRWNLAHLDHLRRFFDLRNEAAANETSDDRTSADPTNPRLEVATGPAGVSPSAPLVEIEDLSFSYPGSSEPVLDRLTLRIDPGETVGLVGHNGSGKTTLVKLLAGLYPPDAGTLRVDGLVPSEHPEIVRSHIAVVFQQYGRYNGTLAENIAFGDWHDLANDRERVERIAERVGVDELAGQLPDGYETMLGREFGAVTLSGGQWQRVAIARAFARGAGLMILDEPTANLDADTEYRVFEQFRDLAAGRSTLLISHRFSTLSLSDRIVVLQGGHVAEQGSHDELMDANGIYAQLYTRYRRTGSST